MNIYLKKHSIIFSTSIKDERKINVKVEIENHNSGLSKKELFIRLTDHDGLAFLFCLKINEDNFQEIKSQQGLLVDFGAFGQKLIDLFNMCSDEEESDTPKYVLKLISSGNSISPNSSSDQWTLNFVETNPFKHLTHLSLRFCHGDTEMFKNHLIECLKKLRCENSTLTETLAHTEASLRQKLANAEACLSEAQCQYQQLQVSSRAQLENLRTDVDQQNRNNKDKLIETESYYKTKGDQEKRDLESNFAKSLRNAEIKIEELQRTNKCLCDENSKLEGDIRDSKNRYESLDESFRQSGLDVQGLRRSKEQCDRTIHDLECHVQKITTRVAVLEQELRDKESLISKTQEMHANEQENRSRYQDESMKRAKQIEKLEKVVKNLNEEVSKGNDIIQKLQNEVKHYHAKVKVRNQITTEQEKVLNERESELKRLSNETDTLRKQLSLKEDEFQKLSLNLEQVTKKVDEANHIIKTNENVINWLNRQVTEYELMKQKSGLSGGQQPRLQPTPQLYSTLNDPMVKYRPTSAAATTSSGDNFSAPILTGLTTKNKFISSSNQVSLHDPPPQSSSAYTSNYDRPVTGHTGCKDQHYLAKSLHGSSEPQAYPQSRNNPTRTVMNTKATTITEESEPLSDQHHQSLTSAYFPKSMMGPR